MQSNVRLHSIFGSPQRRILSVNWRRAFWFEITKRTVGDSPRLHNLVEQLSFGIAEKAYLLILQWVRVHASKTDLGITDRVARYLRCGQTPDISRHLGDSRVF
jgi:hypothetical protein